MREFMIIFKQAFMTKAKTKSFIMTTAIMIASVFLFANMGKIIDAVKSVTGGDSEEVLYVVDGSGVLLDQFIEHFDTYDAGILVKLSGESEQKLTVQVREGEIDSFLTLALDSTKTIHANYSSMSAVAFTLPMMMAEALQYIQTEMKQAELPPRS